MQKLPKCSSAYCEPQDLALPLYTQCVTWTNGNKSTAEMHYHTCAEIGLCIAGSGIFFIGDRVQPFTKGSVTFMPSNVIHIAQSPDDSPSEWKFIFADMDKLNLDERIENGTIISDRDCRNLFNMLFDELTAKNPQYERMYLYLMSCLLIRLRRVSSEISPNNQTHSFYSILPAINFISKNYDAKIRIETLAQMCNISTSLFYRVFNTATGMSPIEYVNSVRISSAENLLKFSSLSILEIAAEVGFSNVSSFFRQFKKINLLSPKEYRLQYIATLSRAKK